MVYLYSTIKMMHGPINMRFINLICFTYRAGYYSGIAMVLHETVSSSNPSLLDVYYKRNLKTFSTFCPNVSTKVLENFELGIVKADLNNKIRLSLYIIRHVDICVCKIIFKLPNNHSVFCDGLIMAVCSSGDRRPHTFAVLQRQFLRHM